MKIVNKIMRLQIGDKLRVNDWDESFTVCGVSEIYVLAHSGQEYTIISKHPTNYQYNGIMAGAYVCAPDYLIFGYAGGYHFDNAEWVERYLNELEDGIIEMSIRRQAEIYSLEMVGE